MKATEMLELLREFHRDKLLERARHVASARVVADYDFNNTYQYVVAREDMHLRWLADAILDLKGELDESVAQDSERSGKGAAAERSAIEGDRESAQRFVDLALAGRTDLLGRRADGAGTGGGVLASRWVGDITK